MAGLLPIGQREGGSNLSRVAINQMAERHGCGRDSNGENYSSSDTAIATMTWENVVCLSMTPVDRTLDLVIDKGDLDCFMCSSD